MLNNVQCREDQKKTIPSIVEAREGGEVLIYETGKYVL